MNYLFAFLELGGGPVCSMAFSASSNLTGASVSRSVLRVAVFFFGLFFRTNPFPAPTGQRLVVFHKPIYFPRQPVPSNAFPVGEPLSFCLLNRNFHTFAVFKGAVIPAEGKFIGIPVKVLAADMVERSHHATFEQGEKNTSTSPRKTGLAWKNSFTGAVSICSESCPCNLWIIICKCSRYLCLRPW
jgi:hypothetical protein